MDDARLETPLSARPTMAGLNLSIHESFCHLAAFKAACLRHFRNLVRAWRLLLDPHGVGRVAFVPFSAAARSMGFKDVVTLWSAIDHQRTGFMTLENWEPVAYRNLIEFREICFREFGALETAFTYGMDADGSAICTREEMIDFCRNFNFTGDPEVLFNALDENRGGYLTVDELEFLERWEGLRFRSTVVAKQFNFDLERLQILNKERRQQHDKLARERLRSSSEREALSERRELRRLDSLAEPVSPRAKRLLEEARTVEFGF